MRPLTILIGKNSSGKSATTKLLTLIEGALNGDLDVPLSLENDGIELGAEFRDLVYGRYGASDLEFWLETEDKQFNLRIASGVRTSDIPQITYWNLNSALSLKFSDLEKNYTETEHQTKHHCSFNGFRLNEISNLNEVQSQDNFSLKQNGFFLKTNYIGPYRFVPDRAIKISLQGIKNGKMGIDGKNAYPFLVKDVLHNKGAITRKLSQWFQENFEGWGLKIDDEKSPNYELQLFRESPMLEINFKDVGQGMIQSLPLVLSSFLSDSPPGLIHVFEQPELHLHPAAHGDLTERFANSTKENGKRYLVETHSKNFVLRLRRLVAEGKLDKNNLIIYYVNYDEEKGESNLREINVDGNGDVDYWPSGVFNESLDEMFAIRKAQKQKTNGR